MEHHHMPSDRPPSYSQFHDQQPHDMSSDPTPSDSSAVQHEHALPSLPTAPAEAKLASEPVAESQFAWPSSNPLTAYYQPGPSKLSPKTRPSDSPKTMDVDTPDSRHWRGSSVLSMDDPDVRMAAEALGDLRADFVQSPPPRNRALPKSSTKRSQANTPQPEPLLSLLTDSHPIIGTAIGGSLSAYSASKNYSPRFKTGAEYMERSFTPIVNTVGSVNRFTGLEGRVRWFLRGRRPSNQSGQEASHKRRKVDSSGESRDLESDGTREPLSVDGHDDMELPHRLRAPSQSSTVESLPAYDEQRSPSYEVTQQAMIQRDADKAVSPGGSWQSRLVLSTSGLSIAMSEESLRSLKYCLGWLRWANEHIGKVIEALKTALEQYDQGSQSSTSSAVTIDWASERRDGQGNGQLIVRSDAERSALNAHIAELKTDVLKTLKSVVDIVSKYAGGALPENARLLVRRHLKSLPQRFRLASAHTDRPAEGGDREVIDGASRVLVLAKEGLDMMSQVSGVLDGTIVSAEEWCERLGMKKAEEQSGNTFDPEKLPGAPPIPATDSGFDGAPDVKMG